MCSTVDTVKTDPEIAPSVAPAAMKPNSRLPCSEVKTSTIICQKIETTNKLKTEVQMKKMRPTQMVCSGVAAYSASANSRMLALKKRYEIAMNVSRGKVLTSQENGRLSSSIPTSVPVNSHCRLLTPPATPIWSRIGRMM